MLEKIGMVRAINYKCHISCEIGICNRHSEIGKGYKHEFKDCPPGLFYSEKDKIYIIFPVSILNGTWRGIVDVCARDKKKPMPGHIDLKKSEVIGRLSFVTTDKSRITSDVELRYVDNALFFNFNHHPSSH